MAGYLLLALPFAAWLVLAWLAQNLWVLWVFLGWATVTGLIAWWVQPPPPSRNPMRREGDSEEPHYHLHLHVHPPEGRRTGAYTDHEIIRELEGP